MKMSEILRQLSDMVAAAEQGGGDGQAVPQTPGTANQTQLTAVEVDNTDNTEPGGVFVPPLQAKLELLKKAVDVDNVYNKGGEDGDLTGQGADNEDEIARMKKMAGVNTVVVDEAGSDEPLDV
jgi:hypothetical protein